MSCERHDAVNAQSLGHWAMPSVIALQPLNVVVIQLHQRCDNRGHYIPYSFPLVINTPKGRNRQVEEIMHSVKDKD
jgi:hypothetical protein